MNNNSNNNNNNKNQINTIKVVKINNKPLVIESVGENSQKQKFDNKTEFYSTTQTFDDEDDIQPTKLVANSTTSFVVKDEKSEIDLIILARKSKSLI